MLDLLLQKCASLPSRTKRGICFFFALAILAAAHSASAQTVPKRPRIFGIRHVRILVTDLSKSNEFYSNVLRPEARSGRSGSSCVWCEKIPEGTSIGFLFQQIELEPTILKPPANRIDEIAFLTGNAAELRTYLLANRVETGTLAKCDGDPCFSVQDPEGHRIVFAQRARRTRVSHYTRKPHRLIHVGFVVRDQAAEDHFYKDILGFRPYWHGGMKDDETNWASLQVPDGSDWVEYMLNVPPDADKHLLGIMNHVALGVRDIQSTLKVLIENGLVPNEQPKIGRDGKWQLNLYDPDQTRIEFMEFTPVQKPCCSEFTAPHPKS